MKDIVVLGGANGAGKTTAATGIVPARLAVREFINEEEIARGISPFNAAASDLTAGRLLLTRIRELADAGKSFAFETTCAGLGHARLLRDCQAKGYRVTLVFLWLPSPGAALARVARRVDEGGHGVPEGVVLRRYRAGLRNLRTLYLPLADFAMIYDNSDTGRVLIAELAGRRQSVHDEARWRKFQKAIA